MKKTSKFSIVAVIVAVLVVLTAVSLIAGLAGGSGPSSSTGGGANHVHRFGEWEGVELCLADSYERRDCAECDYYETRKVEALGHDLVLYEAKAATCTEPGWNTYKACRRCNYTTYTEIPATGHTYEGGVCTGCETVQEATAGLEYVLSTDGTYYICTGIGTATTTDIVIASEVNGIPVIAISEDAFYNNSNITSVVIPYSITEMGCYSFAECTSLEMIYYDGNVSLISGEPHTFENAGKNADNLRLIIGSNTTSLPSYLFYLSYISSSVVVPKNVTNIGLTVFVGTHIETIYFENPDLIYEYDILSETEFLTDIYVAWSESEAEVKGMFWGYEPPENVEIHYNYEG